MALIRRKTSASIDYKITSSPYHQDRTDFDYEVEYTPDKVNGSWVNLPGGSKFRRSTNYFRFKLSLQPGMSQNFSGTYKTSGGSVYSTYARSSPGGYQADIITKQSGSYSKNDSAGVLSLTNHVSIPTMRRNEAVTKALNNIASQKANIGENLATFRQTINLIRSPAGALVDGLRYVRSRPDFRKFLYDSARSLNKKGITSRTAEEYLKYVYGWKPLMSDIHGIIELAKTQGARPLLVNGTGRSKISVQNPEAKIGVASSSQTFGGPLEIESNVRCSLWARFDPNGSGIRTLNQLGLNNPLALAWDLMSWSFVIDWFCPVGPVLNALTAPAGLIFVDGSISNRVSASAEYRHYYDGLLGQYSGPEATGSIIYEAYNRQTITSWPLPGFWIDGDPLRADRSLKALALAIIQLRNLKLLR